VSSTDTHAAEAGWLAAAGQGDREAFELLMNATSPVLWRTIRRLTVSSESAEEVFQETCLAAWRGAPSWTGSGSARAWWFSIARHQAARSWRRRKGEPLQPESLDELGQLAGWGSDPEEAASAAEDRNTLLTALSTLSETDREVIARCDLEGLSAPEAGELLHLTANATRVRLHRARLRLMAALRHEGGTDGHP
jgi:RNA polymerase sigma-70 factor (ECF subfamily)